MNNFVSEPILVDESYVKRFADVSGDHNPVHLDQKYAESTFFKNRIAHGMIVGALFSRYIASDFPGPGSIYMKQTMEFKKPIYLGDSVIIELQLVELNKNNYKIRTIARDQNQNLFVDGEALVKKI